MQQQSGNSQGILVNGGIARRLLALLALGFLFLAGCGGGEGDVSGEVSFGGKPIGRGRITFLSQVGSKKALSASIMRGKYTIKGCPAGLVKIGVESFQPPRPVPKGAAPALTKGFGPGTQEEDPEPNAPPLPYVAIPPRFANPDESGLEYTVQRGPQVHKLDLKP